jgi:hypothetical protein
MTQVTGAHEQHVPRAVGAEDAFDPRDQLIHAVSDAGVPKLPEIGQVLANLGIGKPQRLAELLARDRLTIMAQEALELPEIETQSPDRRRRHKIGAQGLAALR